MVVQARTRICCPPRFDPPRRALASGHPSELTPRPDLLALYKASRKPKELRWYSAGHDLSPAATEYRAQWLLRRLRAR